MQSRFDKPPGDSSRSNKYGYGRIMIRPDTPASADCILAAEGLMLLTNGASLTSAHDSPMLLVTKTQPGGTP